MQTEYEFSVETSELSEILNKLRVYGLCHIPSYLSQNQLDILNKEFENVLSSDSSSVYGKSAHPRNEYGRTARFLPWHTSAKEDFPLMASVFTSEFMSRVAKQYYQPQDVDINDEVFITYEKASEKAILPWHFDRVQSLKFWFNLTDTTAENGAFEYCPGTHWEGHYRAGFHLSQGVPVEKIPNDIDDDLIRNPITIDLKAGDLLIFDPDGFHRGGFVLPGKERRVIRGHSHPKNGRRYGDRPLSAGWWLTSIFNINKWVGSASHRILGKDIEDKTKNRNA
jgi:hypothetical protein